MKLTLIALISSLALGLFLGLLTHRLRIVNRVLPVFSYLFVALIVGGAALVSHSSQAMLVKLSERRWPTVEGEVISSEISQSRGLAPIVRYRFELNGQAYVDSTDMGLPAFGGRVNRIEASEAVVHYYHPGRKVKVHYNPLNPRQSSLRVGPTWDIYMKLSLGAFMVSLGVAGLAVGVLTRTGTVSHKTPA